MISGAALSASLGIAAPAMGYGAQTDSWLLGVGAAYSPTENIEWRLAGASAS
jgi:long-subunit fatty acid transport protein